VDFCAAAALVFSSYRCSAALQRSCFLALQRSSEAQRRSAQRCGFQNLERCTLKKVPIPEYRHWSCSSQRFIQKFTLNLKSKSI
jgi:hypothetical protein